MGWDRPLSIAILALGGQGGGVLTRWLVDIAEHSGFLVQSTFVAGVAQRTGATVYCVEMFPQSRADETGAPVFTPYPVPGDVDLVIAGEAAETGRAIMKGFVTPNVSTLIASAHRVYSIDEKSAMGDGIIDQSPVMEMAERVSKRFICFDMEKAAEESDSIISAVLLGAIAGSGALPFPEDAFRAAIERGGKAVDRNIAGFEAGVKLAGMPPAVATSEPELDLPEPAGPNGRALVDRAASLPGPVASTAAHGALRALEYQDQAYASQYLDAVDEMVRRDSEAHRYAVSESFARNLALQMCYEDTIRVAELKTRRQRFERVRDHLGLAGNDTPAYTIEYFHPRFEEFCDTMPAGIGKRLVGSARARRWLGPRLHKGRNIATNKLGGFLLLSSLARLKRWRRSTYRYEAQNALIADWQERIAAAISGDYELALAIARCIEIVRGYGDTWERGASRFRRSLSVIDGASPDDDKAALLDSLHRAALADEDGVRFDELATHREAS